MRVVLIAAMAAWLAGIPGCGANSPEQPGARADDAESDRVVVLSPALSVVMVDLGLEDRIIGRHAWDMVLDRSVPVCGEQQAINYEALLRAAPTHVLTEWGSRELPERLTGMASERGWVVRDFRMLTLAEIAAAADALEGMFEGAEAGERIIRMRGLCASLAPEPAWSGRVLLLMGTSPIAALGPGSAHHELLLAVGGVPAVTEGSPYMLLNVEDVVRLAPDAIIFVAPRDAATPETTGIDERLGPLAGRDIPAVSAGRIEVVHHPLGLLPSTALADVADWFERAIRDWASEAAHIPGDG